MSDLKTEIIGGACVVLGIIAVLVAVTGCYTFVKNQSAANDAQERKSAVEACIDAGGWWERGHWDGSIQTGDRCLGYTPPPAPAR